MGKKLTDAEIKRMTKSTTRKEMTIVLVDNIFGDTERHELTFDVCDGFAICYDYNGKEYVMRYPTLDFARSNLADRIRQYLGLETNTTIELEHIIQAFSVCKCNTTKCSIEVTE